MIVIMQFEVADEVAFRADLDRAMTTLSARPGYVRGRGGRSLDDPSAWVLVTEWATVGAYRRALGNYDVKLHATPLLARALDRPSGFEALVEVGSDGSVTRAASDRSAVRTRPWTNPEPNPLERA